MKTHTLGSFASGQSAGAVTSSYSLQLNETDNYSKYNIGVFNMVSNGTGTFTLQGCHRTATTNAYEWVDLATGITTGAGSGTVGGSGAKTVALMPHMRIVVTTTNTAAATGYIHQ